jgi:hypothetical protein
MSDGQKMIGGYGVIHPEAHLSEQLYEQYRNAQNRWAREASEDLQIYSGIHWTTEQQNVLLERGQAPVSIQATYQIVDQAVGMLTANNPAFSATAREDSDANTAALWRHVLQYIWQKSNGKLRYKTAVRDYYVQGRGVLYAYVDPHADFGKGEVMFTDLDPKEVFPDPMCRDPLWDDAAHVIVRRIMTGEQIKTYWPEINLQNVKREDGLAYTVSSRQEHNNEILFPTDINHIERDTFSVIERFTKVKKRHYRVMNPDTRREDILNEEQFQERIKDAAYIVVTAQGQQIVSDKQAVAELDALFNAYGSVSHMVQMSPQVTPDGAIQETPPQRVPGPEGPGAIPGSQLELMPMTVGDLIEMGAISMRFFMLDRIKVTATVGDQLLYEPFILETSFYPIVPFPNAHNRNPYPISDVHRVRDLQDLINKTNSLILAHAANSTNLKVFYPQGSIADPALLEQEWSRAGAAFLPYDPALGERGGITIASPPPLPAELYTNMDRFIGMMERIMGVFSASQGDPTSAPATFKGTMAIDEFGARRMKSKMDDLYVSLARLGKVCIDLAQDTYTSEKAIRLFQPDGSIEQEKLNVMQYDDYGMPISRINDVTVGEYDVAIIAGSTLPSNRWAMLQEYRELYQLGLVDQVAVLKRAEIPDADQIIQRSGMIQQMQQMIAQQEETIKSLKGDLQTATREETNARQKAELEKFKANLKTTESDFKKSAQVFDIQLQADRQVAKATQPQQNNQLTTNDA